MKRAALSLVTDTARAICCGATHGSISHGYYTQLADWTSISLPRTMFSLQYPMSPYLLRYSYLISFLFRGAQKEKLCWHRDHLTREILIGSTQRSLDEIKTNWVSAEVRY
jgi:hypothetical protein